MSADDLFVPQDTKVNEEWDRNNALFNYRLVKRTAFGKIWYGLLLGMGLVSALWLVLEVLGLVGE